MSEGYQGWANWETWNAVLWARYDERGRWVLHPERTDERGVRVPESWLYALGRDEWTPAEEGTEA